MPAKDAKALEQQQYFLRLLNKGIIDEREVIENPHLKREPTVEPTKEQILQNSLTFPDLQPRVLTSGFPLSGVASEASTVLENYEQALEACNEAVNDIVSRCKAAGKKFFDMDFFFGSREIMYPDGSPHDSNVAEPSTLRRLNELFPSYTLIDEMKPKATPVQGNIGDGFLIQSLIALTIMEPVHGDPHPLIRNFGKCDAEVGVYGVLFYVHGSWSWVVIDDFIPVEGLTKKPLFASSNGPELWPMVIEKAYAKLHGNWDCIDGGWPREAMLAVTGGSVLGLDLNEVPFDVFTERYVSNPDMCSVVTCTTEVPEEDALEEHYDRGRGLFAGGTYTVIRTHTTSDGKNFVRVRNQWGDDGEWKGAYSPESKEWQKNPLHKMELRPDKRADKGFWMTWKDFVQFFFHVEVVEVPDPADFKTSTYFSTCYSDTTPQQAFVVEVKGERPQDVWVQIGQRNPKIANTSHMSAKNTNYTRMRFNLYELGRLPEKRSEFLGTVSKRFPGFNMVAESSREDKLRLEPGIYGLAPQFDVPEGSEPSEVSYYFRVLHEQHARIKTSPVPDDVTHNVHSRSPSIVASPNTSHSYGRTSQSGPSTGIPEALAGSGSSAASALKANGVSGAPGVIGFSGPGGFDRTAASAYELADPWGRGRIDRRMAEQAFAQLLMHSDIGLAFSKGAAEAGPMDEAQFKNLVMKSLAVSSPTGQ